MASALVVPAVPALPRGFQPGVNVSDELCLRYYDYDYDYDYDYENDDDNDFNHEKNDCDYDNEYDSVKAAPVWSQ